MRACAEQVGRLALIDEQRLLRLAHDERRASLNLLILGGKTPHQGVIARIRPLDDINKLLTDKTKHNKPPNSNRRH